ncbi:MAG: NAD(P)/FAD-dependent oxidoreductase [Candidatus Omnitrophica bacterium]|nr:NAD(P)/FAD-dependent oxidoreductase [Candidatus Omnitrophota bacterium]
MNIFDVIIIGGGVVGAAIARELSRYTLRIALLEKEEELSFGVSKSNSGIIHPGTQNPPHSLKGKLCVQGNLLMRKVAQELGVDFKEVGELIVVFNEKDVSQLEKIKKDAEQLGVPQLQIVRQNWLAKNEPNLSKTAVAALYAPTAGIISPYRLVYDLSENAVRNGVTIHLLSKVENIVSSYQSNKSLFEIHTNKGTFKTRYCVNAAGLFADDIAQLMGINDFTITPRKGEEFILDKKKHYITNHLLFPLPQKTSKGILVIKTADGNPMIGPTAYDSDDKEDVSTSGQGLRDVISAAQQMIPAIQKEDIIAYFAGLRPVAGDDFIIRHEKNTPGCITVAGIQSPGLTAAPSIAVMVSHLLKENGLLLKKKIRFRKYRSKTTHLFAIPFSKTKKLIKKEAAYGDIVCRCEMVSAKEVHDAIDRGAVTLDGIKFRTRAGAGRCHGGFCTTRIMKMLSQHLQKPLIAITKKGEGSEVIKEERSVD